MAEATEVKHIPGPWFAYEGHDGQFMSEPRILGVNPEGGRAPRAVAVCIDTGELAVTEANARLIAAAPELLEALETMHAALLHFRKVGDWSHLHAWVEGKRAETLIARARGAQ
jgi:hypothetical protein